MLPEKWKDGAEVNFHGDILLGLFNCQLQHIHEKDF